MVEMTEVLMERKAHYSQVHEGASSAMVRDPVITNHKPMLNGSIEYLGRQYRSSSECSTDSQVDTLLEEADKIQSSKNGFRKDFTAKKQVRFNMERNQEFFYSYAQASDDESLGLMSNINFVGYKFADSDGYDGDDNPEDYDEESEDDEDDDDEESDDDDDTSYNDPESGHDDSRAETFGYLVDKSASSGEVNNNADSHSSIKAAKLNGTVDLVNGVDDGIVGGKLLKGNYEHQEVLNSKLYEDKRLEDLKKEVLQMESSLQSRQESVQRQMSDLGSKLKKAREDTKQEMDRLQNELEDRKQHYVTEMAEVDRKTEQEKKRFEEELEEFRNEKKLEERRQRYCEHEASISQKEKELKRRAQQAREQDKEIREFEEYLNRRHTVCNGKEEDLNVLQNELETLAQELRSRKVILLKKNQLVHQSSEEDMAISTPPLRARSSSRASVASKGVDLRIEELKSQNRQLLEELFSLKKACESKDEEITDLKEKLGVSENDNKRLQQRAKHLESQLELARKKAELGADSISVDEIMRKTTRDIRSSSRVLRPSRSVAPSSSVTSGLKASRAPSSDSLGTKNTSSTDSGKGTKESVVKSSASKKVKDDSEGRHKLGTERVTSALCTVM